MKNIGVLAFWTAILYLIAATTSVEGSEGLPFTVRDALGLEVRFTGYPERIVSLAPSNTEILYALGLGSRIVGVTDFCDYPPRAQKKEKVGGYNTISLEKIVSVKPDLVVAAYGNPSETLESLRKLEIKVFGLNPRTMDEVLEIALESPIRKKGDQG